MAVSTAIILAGGKGERLRPLTNDVPKPLLKIKGIPIIEHSINNFRKHGISNIILSVGYMADKIMDYFGDGSFLGVKIKYCVEETPLGTGGALKLASKGLTEAFAAINGDNLSDCDWKSLEAVHRKFNAKITLGLFPVEDVSQFGIARLDGRRIVEFVEKPSKESAPSNLSNAGLYLIEPDALDILPEGKSSVERDCFEKLAKEGVIYSYIHTGQWFPTDDLARFNRAENEFNAHLYVRK